MMSSAPDQLTAPLANLFVTPQQTLTSVAPDKGTPL